MRPQGLANEFLLHIIQSTSQRECNMAWHGFRIRFGSMCAMLKGGRKINLEDGEASLQRRLDEIHESAFSGVPKPRVGPLRRSDAGRRVYYMNRQNVVVVGRLSSSGHSVWRPEERKEPRASGGDSEKPNEGR